MILDYKGKRLFAFSDTHGMHRKLDIPTGADILICARDVVSDFQEDGLSEEKWGVKFVNVSTFQTPLKG